ncbi:peptidoglycan D,D-transpeptidase FtsI family protein [Oceanobacillus bengalensis]|uniref:serine-type D-Ala-D-Ala carboxypeptidase n=1 Tax=Oceanobacillus bengalensis TaxID=1435466 RepID=A0A494Z5Q9_9BACI|nr:penicillin-binding protein 2 [Oceanobacillus bengalensis]RKQ17824.1 penicillin-binding protein 2 [Oceanobacillus bengalensis]
MVDKKKKKKKAQLPFRINILFFVIFLLFSVLILQLGVVQILNGEAFQDEIDRTIQDTTKIPVPRGKIYDRYHNIIVDNKPIYSITYTPAKGVQAIDRLKVAKKLAEFITMVPVDEDPEEYFDDTLTERNLKEYWYLENKEEADERISPEETADLSNAEVYNATLDLITEEEISNFSLEEKEVISIKKELDKAYSLTPQIVKNEGVTVDEYAKVSEHLAELPGINATTDWDREYLYESTIQSLLGSITTQEEGIPAENESYYLTRGYSRNDRVGKSGLEEYYEDLLKGRKEQIQYTTTKDGSIIGAETVVEGERGKDLVLSIDMEFQERVDKILLDALKEAVPANSKLNDVLAVVMDPNTGELLAVSGQHYDRKNDEFSNAAFKTIYDAHRPGSVVKGATVLSGFESGVISPGQVFYDRTIGLPQNPFSSWSSTLGAVNDIDALKVSSNVYMGYIALRLGGDYRYPYPNGSSVAIDRISLNNAFQEFRNYFSQFGLGVKTGIDFPYEATGYVGTDFQAGNLLHYAVGQFDTYTTMQLAQYVSTIANGGNRVEPHFMKELREPKASEDEVGAIYQTQNPKVLNRISMDYLDRVQEGFRRVFQEQGGTAASYFRNKEYKPAGKTGTAESEVFETDANGDVYGVETVNLNLIGYAPYDNPEIAFAIVVPNLNPSYTGINNKIGEQIMDTYFELKKERASGNNGSTTDDSEEETENE